MGYFLYYIRFEDDGLIRSFESIFFFDDLIELLKVSFLYFYLPL